MGRRRHEHLDALGILDVDNGACIEKCLTGVPIKANFAKSAWKIWSTIGDRVEIADPAKGEVLAGSSHARNIDIRKSLQALLGSEHHSSASIVLVNENDATS